MAPRRIRRGGNSEDFQLMFLGDVNSGGDGSLIEDGQTLVWDEVAERFQPTGVIPAADLPINVVDFGATGNGVTDDTASIQSALTAAAQSDPRAVYFPAGTYLISDELVYGDKAVLRGDGAHSIIKNSAARAASDYIMLIPDPAQTVTSVLIEGLTFDQRSDLFGFTSSDQCLSINEVAGITIRDCVFKNIITMAIWADTKTADTTTKNVRIENCWIQQSEGGGISVFGDVQDIVITRNRIESCKDDAVGIQALVTGETPVGIIVSDNTLLNNNRRNSSSSTPHAVLIYGCLDTVVTGNLIDSTCASAISIQYNGGSIHSVRAIVSKNIVKNAGVTPDSTAGVPGHGIMALTSDDVQIIDNIVIDSRQYGIVADTVDWLTVAHNRLDNNTSGTISIATSTNVTRIFNGETPITFADSLRLNGNSWGSLETKQIQLANNATATLTNVDSYNAAMGFVFVVSVEDGNAAVFMLAGGNAITYEVSDPANQFTPTATTASSTNIYNEGGPNFKYIIENKRGGTRNYVVHLFMRGV